MQFTKPLSPYYVSMSLHLSRGLARWSTQSDAFILQPSSCQSLLYELYSTCLIVFGGPSRWVPYGKGQLFWQTICSCMQYTIIDPAVNQCWSSTFFAFHLQVARSTTATEKHEQHAQSKTKHLHFASFYSHFHSAAPRSTASAWRCCISIDWCSH